MTDERDKGKRSTFWFVGSSCFVFLTTVYLDFQELPPTLSALVPQGMGSHCVAITFADFTKHSEMPLSKPNKTCMRSLGAFIDCQRTARCKKSSFRVIRANGRNTSSTECRGKRSGNSEGNALWNTSLWVSLGAPAGDSNAVVLPTLSPWPPIMSCIGGRRGQARFSR